MKNSKKRQLKKNKKLLSYISSQDKFKLVGSFVVENFWESFIQENIDSINIYRKIAKDSIEEFIKVYQNVWDYVVGINELDDLFLTKLHLYQTTVDNLSLNELKISIKLLSLSLYSELEKDCLMALNKTILVELSKDLMNKHKFTEQEFQLLMTPSFDTFFTSYHMNHLEYKILHDQKLKEIIKNKLIKNFHSNDEKLFELRFNSMFFPENSKLEDSLRLHKQQSKNRRKEKKNFIGDNKELLAFEKLLEYDNLLDFKYRYNLQACPEFYLRKVLFKQCKDNGLFSNIEKPLQLSDFEFIKGVLDLIKIVEKEYKIQSFDLKNKHLLKHYSKKRLKVTFKNIVNSLKSCSPVLLKSNKNLKNSNLPVEVIIIGYKEEKLICKTPKDTILFLSKEDLYNYRDAFMYQKFSESFTRKMDKMIKMFIKREPYLKRKSYEIAYQV